MKSDDLSSFGRETIRARVNQRVEALMNGYRQNMALVGQSGLGKTHLLSSFYRHYKKMDHLLVVYCDVSHINFEQFVERWIYSFLDAARDYIGASYGSDQLELFNKLKQRCPRTYEVLMNLRNRLRMGDKNGLLFRSMLTLTGVFSKETNSKILLILDDFEQLGELPLTDPFGILGKEIMVQKETMFLASCSCQDKANEIFNEKLAMLFGNFEVLQLEPMTVPEVDKLLKELQPGFNVSQSQVHYLHYLTSGVPAYLEVFVNRLGMLYPKSHAISHEDEETQIPLERWYAAIHYEMFDKRGKLYVEFKNRLEVCKKFGKDYRSYIEAILAIAQGEKKVSDIANKIHLSIKDCKKIIEKLCANDLIYKKGSFYVVGDSLYQYWLREVYLKKMQSFNIDFREASEAFYESLQKDYQRVIVDQDGEFVSQVERMFLQFRNDLIEIHGKQMRAPQFQEVRRKQSKEKFDVFVAKNAKARWLCYVANSFLGEEDIFFIQEDMKRFRKKQTKLLLIAVNGMDQNSKLIAQEMKMLIWDNGVMNMLFDVYNFPKMIPAKLESFPTTLATTLTQPLQFV